ncbi:MULTISPECIES: IDEAL domain-containing protein [unclassified Psychrobacillus]|uniref:IDEAL domain-containing protein n=1 Tax=unclassified Psychrobacillus TaxID=2636677 RepID=UPI00146A96E5|nr:MULTISPECIES: IDEAL domain-containing protein [unclassified Psychrobacillus]MCM3358730.1 IDEAL domain-containing protein [Psychrobacillus sp. MER TA 171]NME06005.1 IDEAL domain-containing protein [Psychrobacillus sp. BL-248-WT-3]
MDKQYSYTDFMKAMGQTGKESSAEKLLNEIYLDMFLNVVHREQRSFRLMGLIDEALDRKDKEAFNEYTNVLLHLKN